MEAVLSIKGKWWEKIKDGTKTTELRKVYPKNLKKGDKIYIHVSGTNAVQGYIIYGGAVLVGEREFDKILSTAAITISELLSYSQGKNIYAWRIERVCYWTKEQPLSYIGVKRAPQSFEYIKNDLDGENYEE